VKLLSKRSGTDSVSIYFASASWKKFFFYGLLPPSAILLSFALGRYPVSPGELWSLFSSALFPSLSVPPEILSTIVFNIRLPRILAALLVGASLSGAGACYQGMFHNPLASPALLGAAAGAGFGAALGICLGFHVLSIQVLSFLASLSAVGITCLLSVRIRHDRTLGLVLGGILTGSLFTAATSLVKYTADPFEKLPAITFWLMGSFSSVTMEDVYLVGPPIFLGLGFLYLLRWHLNVLSLPEEEARALGVRVHLYKLVVILCATLATAASVSISGMIGWVGLVIPHFVRILAGPDYLHLLPASLVGGGIFLLLMDNLARTLASVEIPLGILTALVGVPFFLFLLFHEEATF